VDQPWRQVGRGGAGAAQIGDDGADVFRRELAQTVVDPSPIGPEAVPRPLACPVER